MAADVAPDEVQDSMEKSEENFATSPGSLDLDVEIRSLLSEVIRQSPKKREQIAEEISHLVDRSVSASMLNHFTAESREGNRFPAAWIPAFCTVTGDLRLLQLLAGKCSLQLADSKQWRLIQFAEAILAKERAERDLEKVRASLLGGSTQK